MFQETLQSALYGLGAGTRDRIVKNPAFRELLLM
jgi:hypothetical protein